MIRVKVVGKESTKKGWQELDEHIGAVKINVGTKLIVITAAGKIIEYQKKEIET